MMFQKSTHRHGLATLALLLLVIGFADLAHTKQGIGDQQTKAEQTLVQKLTAEERVWLSEHPVIRVVQDPGWPPIEFVNEQGKFVGMAGDYLQIIEQRLGVKFERVQGLSWQEAYIRLKRWDIDMTTSVAVTPERNEFWAFTGPYMKIPIVMVTAADVTYIATMQELAGKKVAVVDGYAVNDWIPRDFPDIQLVRFKTAQECLKALQRGEVFAYIDNMLVVGYYMARLKMTMLKIAGETPYVNAQCMAVRKDWAPLAGILQKALASISETERNDIYRKWLPIRYEHGFDYTLLWYALAVFALILSGLAAWNWKLLREVTFRKKAEFALRQSEEKFRLVFEVASVGKSITLPSGGISVNKAFCDMLGYTRDELQNKKWQELSHPDEIEATQNILEPLLQGRKDSARFNKRYIHKNGTFVWADVSLAIHRDRKGNNLFFITTVIDITERRHAEEELVRTAQEWQNTFDATNDAIWILDRDNRILRSNKTAERFFHRPPGKLIGKHCWEIVHHTAEPIPECPNLRLRESLQRETMELAINGTWFEVTVDPVLDAAGRHNGSIHIVSDINTRKKMEATLLYQQELMNQMGKIAKIGGWVFDPATGQGTWTEEVASIHELDPNSETSLQMGLTFYQGDSRSQIERAVRDAITLGQSYDLELELITANGIHKWVRTIGHPVVEDGKVVNVYGSFQDITAQREAEKEILKLNEELEHKVQERTAELQRTITQLEETNKVFIGRELKMVELKKRIAELEKT